MSNADQSRPSVRIVEVGPRDGLQNIKKTVPSATKIELIELLARTGLTSIELTSIVSPKAVPQLADYDAVLRHQGLKKLLHAENSDKALRGPVLTPNLKGLEKARGLGVRDVAVFISASEGFSRANINCSRSEGLRRAVEVARQARGYGMQVRGYVSSIFACPFDGKTPPDAVLDCVAKLLEAGCYEVSLGDTLGVGVPSETKALIQFLARSGIPTVRLAGHFHDTYGQATANAWASYECGIRVFDSSVAGLGGCPYAPGAKGNVATEDLVYMFEQAGVHTGVNLPMLVDTGIWISQQLSRPNQSRAGNALAIKGKRLEWHPYQPPSAPEDEIQIHQSGVNIRITLNRPRNGNALTANMIDKLTTFFEKVPSLFPHTCSRILLAANGKYFCTGMDLSRQGTAVGETQSSAIEGQFTRLSQLFDAVERAPQVTLACVQGPAFGGGVGLVFACDVRFACRDAVMTLSEVRLGLCPATISRWVVREWGFAFVREAMLSGRPVAAAELLRVGAFAGLAEDASELTEVVGAYLARLRGSAPGASRMCKELVRLGWSEAGRDAQVEGTRRIFREMMGPSSEGAFGVVERQRGVREIDWDSRSLGLVKSKL